MRAWQNTCLPASSAEMVIGACKLGRGSNPNNIQIAPIDHLGPIAQHVGNLELTRDGVAFRYASCTVPRSAPGSAKRPEGDAKRVMPPAPTTPMRNFLGGAAAHRAASNKCCVARVEKNRKRVRNGRGVAARPRCESGTQFRAGPRRGSAHQCDPHGGARLSYRYAIAVKTWEGSTAPTEASRPAGNRQAGEIEAIQQLVSGSHPDSRLAYWRSAAPGRHCAVYRRAVPGRARAVRSRRVGGPVPPHPECRTGAPPRPGRRLPEYSRCRGRRSFSCAPPLLQTGAVAHRCATRERPHRRGRGIYGRRARGR